MMWEILNGVWGQARKAVMQWQRQKDIQYTYNAADYLWMMGCWVRRGAGWWAGWLVAYVFVVGRLVLRNARVFLATGSGSSLPCGKVGTGHTKCCRRVDVPQTQLSRIAVSHEPESRSVTPTMSASRPVPSQQGELR